MANLSTRRGTLRVEVLVLAALADLNYTTLVLGRSRNHNDYYDTANQLLKMVSGELGNIDWQNQDDLADSLLIITAFCNKIAVQ